MDAKMLKSRSELRLWEERHENVVRVIRESQKKLAIEGRTYEDIRGLIPRNVYMIWKEMGVLDEIEAEHEKWCPRWATSCALYQRCLDIAPSFQVFMDDKSLCWSCRIGGQVYGAGVRPLGSEDVHLILMHAHECIGRIIGVLDHVGRTIAA